MVILNPLSRIVSLINGLSMAYKWGLLATYPTGMILQVVCENRYVGIPP